MKVELGRGGGNAIAPTYFFHFTQKKTETELERGNFNHYHHYDENNTRNVCLAKSRGSGFYHLLLLISFSFVY